jgi:ectoine hydroxylase
MAFFFPFTLSQTVYRWIPPSIAAVYLSLCACSNHIRRFKRPEYIAHRDFTPIVTLPDDCLVARYPVDLPWKDGTPESAYKTQLETA